MKRVLSSLLLLTLFISGWLPGSLQAQQLIATASISIDTSSLNQSVDPTVATPMVIAADRYALFDGFTLNNLTVGNTYTICSNAEDPDYTGFIDHLTGADARGALGVMSLNTDDTPPCDVPLPPDTLCGYFLGYFRGGGVSSGNLQGYFAGWFTASTSLQDFFVPSSSLSGATVGSISLTLDSLVIGTIDPDTGLAPVEISYTIRVFAGGGACCDGETCTEITENECDEVPGAVWFGNSSCSCVNPCLTGACCSEGSCTPDLRADECANLPNSIWLGPDSTCDGDPCIKGACCETNGVDPASAVEQVNGLHCSEKIESQCFGPWNPTVACEEDACDPVPGACFAEDGTCEAIARIDCFDRWEGGPCPAKPVPTVTQWGLIVLSLLLIGSATWFIRRRSKQKS